MNPLAIITLAAMGVVGSFGLYVLPPDAQFEQTTPYVDVWSDDYLPEPTRPTAPASTERPLPAPQTSATTADRYCPAIVGYARSEGFWAAEAAMLAKIAWHESRCREDVLGDLDRGTSHGILQIHGPSWCEPNRWWPDGYLQAALIVETCSDLLDPRIAVRAARAIYLVGGFEQWTTYRMALDS